MEYKDIAVDLTVSKADLKLIVSYLRDCEIRHEQAIECASGEFKQTHIKIHGGHLDNLRPILQSLELQLL